MLLSKHGYASAENDDGNNPVTGEQSGMCHHPAPLEIAGNGDDDVEGVEWGLEWDVLVEIKDAGDNINGNPDEPLLQIFVGQCPNADDAEGCGERVG